MSSRFDDDVFNSEGEVAILLPGVSNVYFPMHWLENIFSGAIICADPI